MGILEELPSRRTPVRQYQADLLAMLIDELAESWRQRERMTLDDFTALPEYERLVAGMYACGVVCRDLEPLTEEWDSRRLQSAAWPAVRHWLHTLARSERWNYGWSSPIMRAIESGTLQLVARRLRAREFVLSVIDQTAS